MKLNRYRSNVLQLNFMSSKNGVKASLSLLIAVGTAAIVTGCPNQTSDNSTPSPQATAETALSPSPLETPIISPPLETPAISPPLETPVISPPLGTPPISPPLGTPAISPPLGTSPTLPPTTANPPGGKSQTVRQLETQISNLLSPQLGVPITSVNCPSNVEIKAGSQYECQAVVDNTPFTVELNIQDASGAFKVNSKGIVLLPKIERSIAANVKQQKGIDITVNCGGQIKVARAGDTFECQATLPGGKTQPAKITVNDDYGNVRFEL
ncbi:MAG: DUF4333 domain-containing protein [Cyanosarcina radialis HA8281-LM2]|jgi:hypothetical protein|nr:DUF4333 domain-containing protein [Cyanosarcina radialis HA8281-LM2]